MMRALAGVGNRNDMVIVAAPDHPTEFLSSFRSVQDLSTCPVHKRSPMTGAGKTFETNGQPNGRASGPAPQDEFVLHLN
jgi:hypothetical protein